MFFTTGDSPTSDDLSVFSGVRPTFVFGVFVVRKVYVAEVSGAVLPRFAAVEVGMMGLVSFRG